MKVFEFDFAGNRCHVLNKGDFKPSPNLISGIYYLESSTEVKKIKVLLSNK